MKTAGRFEFSPEQQKVLVKARWLSVAMLVYLATDITLLYVLMGNSQAMKAAWLEDVISTLPAAAFLISSYVCWKAPTEHFPYGFHRSVSIAYLVAAISIVAMGTYIFIDSAYKLITFEHATIGMKKIFGHDVWLGWLMVAVVPWGTLPPLILGRMKLKLAPIIHDKVLYTEAQMNKADWLTAAAMGAGVLGIGVGWWWADPLAAIIISCDILKDGLKQSRDSVTELMNRAPKTVEGKYFDLPEKVKQRLLEMPWIEKAEVRLYEQGHLIYGEGFFTPVSSSSISPQDVRKAEESVESLDWRLFGFTLSVTKDEDIG